MRPGRQDSEAGPGHIFVYVALLGAHVALIWLLPFFPTQDGPSHLYNLVILRDMLAGAGGWEKYYALNLHLAPNLGFTLFTYPWLSMMPPIAAEGAFLTIYVLLYGASAPVFLRAFGKPAFPLSYFAFVPIFGQSLVMGFYSEVIGTPLLLLGVALAWKMRESRALPRFLALNAAGLVLFVIHLIPFAIYLLAVGLLGAVEAGGWPERVRRGAARVALMSPCLAAAVVFYLRHRIQGPVYGPIRFGLRVGDLLSFGEYSYSAWQMVPGVAALLLVCLAAGTAFQERGASPAGEELVARRFIAALWLVLFAAYLFAPDSLVGGALLKRRLPPLLLLLGLPLLVPRAARLTTRGYAWLAAALAVLTLGVNGGVLWRESLRVEKFARGVQAGLPRGATLLSARLDGKTLRSPDPLMHAACYFGLQGAVDLGQSLNYEKSEPYFQIRFRHRIPWEKAIQVYKRPGAVDWSELPRVQFLLCWDPDNACAKENLERDFAPHWSEAGNPLTIWKRRTTAGGGATGTDTGSPTVLKSATALPAARMAIHDHDSRLLDSSEATNE